MIELNKTQLTNSLKKIGNFIKKNSEKDSEIYNKIKEVFPEASNVDIYNESKEEISFVTNCKYTGRINLKKELNDDFDSVCNMSGIFVMISVINEDVCITSDILIKYFDKYNNLYYNSVIIKELNM